MIDKSQLVSVEYIEKGCFQGGEEDCSLANIKSGDECFVISKNLFDALKSVVEAARRYAGSTVDCCMSGEATGEVCELHQALAMLEECTSTPLPPP